MFAGLRTLRKHGNMKHPKDANKSETVQKKSFSLFLAPRTHTKKCGKIFYYLILTII